MIHKIITFLSGWSNWEWAEIIKILISIWIACTATRALNTWKRQSKAQKQTDFIDEITESVHEFSILLADPIEMVKFVKIKIASHVNSAGTNQNLGYPEVIAYIQKDGQEDARKLSEYLKPCTQSLSKIRSLAVKGHVFGFKKYSECQNACTMITRQYDRIQHLCYIISHGSLNWENPLIQASLNEVIRLDADDIINQLVEQHEKFLTFIKDNYKTIYK